MINVFLLMIVWSAIVAMYYYMAKWLTQDLEERRFIDLITSPFIRLQGLRSAKPIEFLGVLIGFIGFLSSTMGYTALFKKIQSYLFHRSDDFFVADNSILIFTIIILSFGVWLLVFLGINRYGDLAADSKWKQNIEIWEAHHLSRRAKNRGIITALILQFVFVLSMTNYTIVGDEQIQHASFLSIIPTTYTIDEIQSAGIYVKTDDDGAYFEFDIILPDGTTVGLVNNSQELLHYFEELKQLAQTLEQKNISVNVEKIGFLKQGRMRREMRKEVFDKTIEFFKFFSTVGLGINKTFEIGEVATYKNAQYRVDSVLLGKNLPHLSKDRKHVIVYMTIENQRDDTLKFYKTISLKLIDADDNSHLSTFTGADELGVSELLDKIPPHQTATGAVVYYVPKEEKDFTLVYDFSYVNDHELRFNLGQPNSTQFDKVHHLGEWVAKTPFSYQLDSVFAIAGDYLNLYQKDRNYLVTYWTIRNNSNTEKTITSHYFKLQNEDETEKTPVAFPRTWKRDLPKIPRKIGANETVSGVFIYNRPSDIVQGGTISCISLYPRYTVKFAYTTEEVRQIPKFKPKNHPVGATVNYDNLSYKVHKAWIDDGTYFRQLGKDRAFLMVDISITNHNYGRIKFNNLLDLRLDDRSTKKENQLGHRPISSYVRKEPNTLPEYIQSEETVRGHLIYWIPKTSNNFILKTPIEYGDYDQVRFQIVF